MDGTAPISARSYARTALSCMRCSSRKVKCDRQRPTCSACSKHAADCVYAPEPPTRQKPRRRIKDLTNLVRHYESLLEQSRNGTAVLEPSHHSNLTHAIRSPPNQVAESAAAIPLTFKQPLNPLLPLDSLQPTVSDEALVATMETGVRCTMPQRPKTAQIVFKDGKSKLIEKCEINFDDSWHLVTDMNHSDLWDRVVEEFGTPEDALCASSDEDSSIDDTNEEETGMHAYLLYDRDQDRAPRRPQHPSAPHVRQLCNIFATNVDPLVKVLHMPSLRVAIDKAMTHIKTIPRGFEALMFSLYAAAIMSLPDEECKQVFGESRQPLMERYVAATRRALARANFMSTTSLVVLQALFLHIVTIRNTHELRSVWTLTGVAVRIAQSMGLNRPNMQNLSPFEDEMRRRLWWNLHTHDWRCAELCGMSKFRDLEPGVVRPERPTNVNDDDIFPSISVIKGRANLMTDLAFLNMRMELIKFASKQIERLRKEGVDTTRLALAGMSINQEEIVKDRMQLEDIFETQFIRYCDPSQPLQFMVMTFARHAITVTAFLMNHPRRWQSLEYAPPEERRYIWDLSIKLLEQHCVILCNPLLSGFAWHAPFFTQWHGFIHILDALRADPLIARADLAWRLIAQIYQYTPELTQDMRKPIHVAVGSLCLKAYRARELAVQHGLIDVTSSLKFIAPLSEQLQLVRNRADSRRARSQQPPEDPGIERGKFALGVPPPTQTSFDNSAASNDMGNLLEGDTGFWLADGLGDFSFANTKTDTMEVDPEWLAPDSANMDIDWTIWDVWLTNSNLMGQQR